MLVSAKALTLAGRHLPLSPWAPFAFFWQDAFVAIVFYSIDRLLKREKPAWCAYALLAAYTAVNVPITLVLSTPLTWTMIRATRGALSDAVLHYATAVNLIALLVPVIAAVALPIVLRRVRPGRWGQTPTPTGGLTPTATWGQTPNRVLSSKWGILGAVAVLIGPVAVSRVETHGMHRSALGALVATSLPRLEPAAGAADWRESPFGTSAGEDLSALRGSMAGRNVLLVVLESTGARHLGLYGAAVDPTPRLTALGRQAIVFERAYAVYPESIKGLFATLCSKYPAFDTPPEIYANVPCAPLPRTLAAAGYRTALFHSGRFAYLGMSSIIERRGFDLLEDAGAIGGQVNSSFGVDDASTVRRALGWIASLRAEERFFLTYLPVSGHNPYDVTTPGPFEGRDDFTRYLNALHEGDVALGALLDGLQRLGRDRDTLVIVFGDHGEAFGEHPGNFAHTLFIQEENVRVPYLMAAAGAIDRSIRVQRIASIVDTAPTILDLLGLPADAAHQGTSLLNPQPRMAMFFTDYSIGWLGLADGCWKYLHDLDAGRSRLFDVCTDPGESRDRAAEFPERVSAYRDRVRGWAAAQKEAVK